MLVIHRVNYVIMAAVHLLSSLLLLWVASTAAAAEAADMMGPDEGRHPRMLQPTLAQCHNLGTSGAARWGDDICDDDLNNGECQYDGGDCCVSRNEINEKTNVYGILRYTTVGASCTVCACVDPAFEGSFEEQGLITSVEAAADMYFGVKCVTQTPGRYASTVEFSARAAQWLQHPLANFSAAASGAAPWFGAPARRSSAEQLIATKALRCTATAWIPHCR